MDELIRLIKRDKIRFVGVYMYLSDQANGIITHRFVVTVVRDALDMLRIEPLTYVRIKDTGIAKLAVK